MIPRRRFDATRHETGFDDLRNNYAWTQTFGAAAFAADEAVRSRIGQGRQDHRRRPFSIESAPIVASQKRSAAVRRYARQRHPSARKNTIPIILAAPIPPRLRSIRLQ
jgi:hypothetical protein